MTHGTSGMRKGISLVEMMIAIVLLGVLSVIGYKYYKNFFDTDLVAKKARMATVVDQASQLSSAYDVYQQQFGTAPDVIAKLTDANVQILKTLPTMPSSITATGWTLNVGDVDGAGAATDSVFVLPLDGTATTADKKKYCRVFNNMMINTKSLTDESSYANADGSVPLLIPTAVTGMYALYTNAFCVDETAASTLGTVTGLKIVFVKQLN